MKPRSRLFIVSFLLLLAVPCLTYAQEITFNKVSSSLGSFGNFLGGITQDKNGYMWFATGAGLYWYDGYKFKLYINTPEANSLSQSHLEAVYADREGMIWIATWASGLDRLDLGTGKFTHFKHDPNDQGSISDNEVRAFLEDRDGVLWVGTHGGLDKYNPVTGKFQHYRHDDNDPQSLSCNMVRALYQDRKGTIWVGTGSVWEGGETDEGGLNRFDKRTGKFARYMHDPDDPHSLINNKVRAIFEDSRGIFWVGTAGDGLHTMNRATGKFERHLYDSKHPDKLSRPALNYNYGPDHITFINEDVSGAIWIGTLGNGVVRYDPKTQKLTHYGYKDSSQGFTHNSGWSCYNSRDGILWIGTLDGGLYRVDPNHKNIKFVFNAAGVSSLNMDSSNGIWIGTSQGLLFENKSTGNHSKFVHSEKDRTSLTGDIVTSLCRDDNGQLWVSTTTGVNRFNAQSNNFTRYQNDPINRNNTVIGAVYEINKADGDSLWLVTDSGLVKMNTHTGSYIRFSHNPGIYNLLSEGSGNLWVARSGGQGVDYFDHTTRTFTNFLKGLGVLSIFKASSGTIWIGSDEGLYEFDSSNKGFKKFILQERNLENILTIQEDNKKNLWVSTPSGIFKLDLRNNQVTVYTENYGVDAGSLNLGGYKGKQGELYFFATNGYYTFSPDELTANTTPPQILFTNLIAAGRPLTIENAKQVVLQYNQNIFSLDFAGIHYGNPGYNQHIYMLERYDHTWHEAGNEKTATYFNVPPGKYIFHVKASNSDGIWAEKSITIVINAPWWRTWWAYCLYGLILISVGYSFHRFQKQRIIRTERERTRERELAQSKEIQKAYHELKTTQAQLIHSEKMASLGELTAGIAHEIQNPLNFVNNFSEVNGELISELVDEADKGNTEEVKLIAEDIRQNLEKINHHGKRADAIVKGMLQHSRQSSGKKEPVNINALADEYLRLSYHGMRAKDKEFNADIQTDFDETLSADEAGIGKINVVPQDVGRVLLNLFNNAFYAVNEKKKSYELSAMSYEPLVSIQTKKLNDKIEIIVSDNGSGIPSSIKDKIFQPFFTTKPTGQGTGLGLSLSYDIIKAHGGEIKVDSKEGEGSKFIVQLPA